MNAWPSQFVPRRAAFGRRLRRAAALWLGLAAAAAGNARAQGAEPSLSAALRADRAAVFTREVFPVTLTIEASGVQLGQDFGLEGLPDDGRLSFGPFRELPPQREQRGGRAVEVRRFVSDAQAGPPGPLRVAPTLQAAILLRRWGLFGPFTEEVRQSVPVLPLALTVRPLPEAGRPAEFSGAVGQFSLEAEAAPRDVAVGDLVQVALRLRGAGDLKGVTPPRVPAAADFKVYEPRALGAGGAEGWRFEQTVVPLSATATQIPPAVFVFFDPRAEVYRALTAGPFALRFHERSAVAFEPYRPPPAAVPAAAPPPAARPPERWTWAAAAAYWAAAGGAAAFGVTRRRRGARLAAALGLALAVAMFPGFLAAVRRQAARAAGRPLLRAEQARLAPSSAALATFALPSGAVVRITGAWEEWRRIDDGERSGWIPADALSSAGLNP